MPACIDVLTTDQRVHITDHHNRLYFFQGNTGRNCIALERNHSNQSLSFKDAWLQLYRQVNFSDPAEIVFW